MVPTDRGSEHLVVCPDPGACMSWMRRRPCEEELEKSATLGFGGVLWEDHEAFR